MPILDERHDRQHPVEDDEAWSESYYFNAYDPVTDTGFFSRIGVRPNEGTIDSHFALWLPDGDVAHLRHQREQTTMIDTHLEVGPVTYDCVTPMQEWRLQAAGEAVRQVLPGGRRGDPVQIAADVTFHAPIPASGADGQGGGQQGSAKATSGSVGKGHLEQSGRWTGRFEVAGTTIELGDARGNRDKSWGPRQWGGPTMWRWFSINIGDDVHLGGIRIGTSDNPADDLHRGWIWTDGEPTSVREWQVRTETADDGLTQRVVHLTVLDKADRVHELRGDVLRVAPLPRASATGFTVVNEGLTRWTYADRTGYGIAEYLHQLDAEGTPRRPIV